MTAEVADKLLTERRRELLAACRQDGDDVRSITVGEPMRRLTSKCLCASVKDEARTYFWPLQVGVVSLLGWEAAAAYRAERRSLPVVLFASSSLC